MSETMQVRSFHCNNCGSPLQVPSNSKGKVVCPSCKTECVIEGLVKNAEILEKENINSGVSINLVSSKLNDLLVTILTNSPSIPLDVLEKGIVVKEEHICIPSYLYYCNAMAPFTYEAGNQREHKTAIDLGDKTRVEKETYTEWTQMSSSTSLSTIMIASGNREYASIIQKLFMHYDSNKLIDIEELEVPFDIKTCSYNLPQSSAFNEYIKPYVENLLTESAENSLSGKTYKNLTMGGSNVQKDEIIRISLSIYCIYLQYNGATYSIYIAGDGSNYCFDELPVDVSRQQYYNDLIAKKNEPQKAAKIFLILAIVSAVAALFTMGISLIGTVLFGFLHFKGKKQYKSVQDDCQGKLDVFTNQINTSKQSFLQNGNLINGLSGD